MVSVRRHVGGSKGSIGYFVVLMAVFILFALVDSGFAETTAADAYDGGTGTVRDPYQIATLAQLRRLSETESDWSYSFILTSDIDASETASWNEGQGFSLIGMIYRSSPGSFEGHPFSGNFNGNDHVISGLVINRTDLSEIGFFGYLNDATVKNLVLKSINISGSSTSIVGGVAGYICGGSIANIAISDSVINGGTSGGFAGIADGSLSNCYSGGSVNGDSHSGGFAGYIGSDSTLSDCSSDVSYDGSSSSLENLGGFAGYIDSDSTLSNCTSTGGVSYNGGSSSLVRLGGFAGYIDSDSILSNCTSTGDVSYDGDSSTSIDLGGFAGIAGGSLSNCSSTGDVSYDGGSSSSVYFGGFAGRAGGSLSNCSSTGDVSYDGGSSSSVYFGGFAGRAGDSLSNCSSTGDVSYNGGSSSWTNLGGFAGITGGLLSNCTSIGGVSYGGASSSWVRLGGFAGVTGGSLSKCTSTGGVSYNGTSSWEYLGGFVGLTKSATFESCYASGSVAENSGDYDSNIGGFVGAVYRESSPEFVNCRAFGDIVTGSPIYLAEIGLFLGEFNESCEINCSYGTGSIYRTYELFKSYKLIFENSNDAQVGLWAIYYDEDDDCKHVYYDSESASEIINNQCLPLDEDVPVIVSVYDAITGNYVESASVQFAGDEKITDSNGEATFTVQIPASETITITASGYGTVSRTEFLWSKMKQVSLSCGLVPLVSGKPQILDVTSTSDYSGISKPAFFLDGQAFSLKFTANVNWNNATPGTITFRTPNKEESTTDGIITLNMGSDFGAGGRLIVIATAEDGTESEPFDANIEVMANVFPYTPLLIERGDSSFKYYSPEVELGLFEEVEEFEVSDNFPLLDGLKIEFAPVFTIGIEVNSNQVKYSASKSFKDKKEGLTLFGYTPTIGEVFTVSGDVYNRYSADDNDWHFSGGGLTFKAGLIGEILEIGPYYAPITVPVYLKLKAGAGINGSLTVGMESEEPAEWIYSGKLGGNINGGATFGGGIDKLCAIEGTASACAATQFTYSETKSSNYVANISLTGEVSVIYFFFETSLELGTCSWGYDSEKDETSGSCEWGDVFYSLSPNSQSLQSVTVQAVSVLDDAGIEWQPMDRDYSKKSSQNVQAPSSLSATSAERAEDIQSIPDQQGVFPYSSANLIHSDDGIQLVWVTDDQTKNSNNRTSLLYSKYQGSAWTQPVKILEDGTADFMPVMGALSSGTLLAWQDSNTVFGEDDITLSQFLASQDISVAVYDPENDTWGSITNLTNNDSLDRSPVLSTSQGNAMVAWVNNVNNNLTGSDDAPNTIGYALYNGTGWTTGTIVSGLGAITDMDVYYDVSQGYGVLVYVLDGDSDLSDTDDQELYQVVFSEGAWSSPTQLTSNSDQDTNPKLFTESDGTVNLFWKQGQNLVQAMSFDIENYITIVSGDDDSDFTNFKIVTRDGKLAFIWGKTTENGQNLFTAVYDDNAQIWGKSVQISSISGIDRSYTGMFTSANATLLVVYNHANLDFETTRQIEIGDDTLDIEVPQITTTDLAYVEVPVAADVAVVADEITVDSEQPVPYDSVELSVSVSNLGLVTEEAAVVSFYYGDPEADGELIGEQEVTLYPGYSSMVTQSYTIPETVDVDTPIFANICAAESSSDADLSNNSILTQIFFNDLSVEYLYSKNQGPSIRKLTAVVKNTGAGTCENIPVAFKHNETTIYSETIASLDVGESYQVNYGWSVDSIYTDNDGFLVVEVLVDEDDTIDEATNVNNAMQTMVSQYGEIRIDVEDSDFDGLRDQWENDTFGDLSHDGSSDTDNDGLTDGQEYELKTDPTSDDTDGDGMSDGWEVDYSLDPTADNKDEDTDSDGLTDGQEYELQTDPTSNDTDGDGMSDGWEINYSLDPTTDDNDEDADNDGLTNSQEYELQTDPTSNDTDGDGMPDGWEVNYSLDPTIDDNDEDEDGDGQTNYQEYINGTNPTSNDTDNDGLTDGEEYELQTDPTSNDTDGDGMPDGWEFNYSLEPKTDDKDEDADNDGLTNGQEYELQTDPTSNDTDGDGMPDGWEVNYFLDPKTDDKDEDKDGDGQTNYQEFLNGTNPILFSPINDNFAQAVEITETGSSYIGSNLNATYEAENGEPSHEGVGSNSAWWRWTAEQEGLFTISTYGSSFDTVLSIYTGDELSDLERIAGNNQYDDDTSKVFVKTENGTTYYIAVDSYSSDSQGDIVVTIDGPFNSMLFVDDDEGDNYETYFTDALDANSYNYLVWDSYYVSFTPDSQILSQFDLIIWNTGANYSNESSGLTSSEQESISDYLNQGGRIFLSGQDILYNGVDLDFQENYLHISNFSSDTGADSATAVIDDPISDGLDLTLSYPFEDYSDTIVPDSSAVGIFENSASEGDIAIRFPISGTGTFRLVFFAFPFESISLDGIEPNNSVTVMKKVVDWLTLACECQMDEDSDGDVDGSDLGLLIHSDIEFDLESFVIDFGKTNCCRE